MAGGSGSAVFAAKRGPGVEAAERVLEARAGAIEALRQRDPAMTGEQAVIEMASAPQPRAATVPPAFLWYYHAGFRDVWNRHEWGDPSMPRPFDEYFSEAVDSGWWEGLVQPPPDVPPRVLLQCGGNVLRRTRGGRGVLLEHLWPKLRLIVTLDPRMSMTALFSDIVLPVANEHEKYGFGIGNPEMLLFNFLDRAVAPPGEVMTEREIFGGLLQKLEERARARGFVEYEDTAGRRYRLEQLYDAYSKGGAFGPDDEERVAAEIVLDTALAGAIPPGTTLETMREQGSVRYTDWGFSPMRVSQASEIRPDEAHAPLRRHTEELMPYPTLVRRAQVYIDHEWFIEAGEELPTHKDPPRMGGDYPFVLTSGHSRWSIHAINIANELMLDTHRGSPLLVMNTDDASAKGIADDDKVQVTNDMGSFVVSVKLSPGVMPGQVVCYNGWEPYQFEDWKGPNEVETNMVRWLNFAGGYGHLRFYPMMWQPAGADRATRVEVSRAN